MTAQLVRNIASEAFADAIDVLRIVETLEAGNDPAAVAAVNAAQTDAVARCVYRALWTRLVLIVTRAYADARLGDRHVQYAFDLVMKPALRVEVEQLGNASALAEAITLWSKCRGDHRLPAIRSFRDTQIAHWSDVRMARPIINDIFDVSRATVKAIERLAQGSGVVTLSLDSQLVSYKDEAKRFWV
jgi:AbiU2